MGWIKARPEREEHMMTDKKEQEPVGTVKDLFTQAAWEKLDVRGSTKVYLGTPPEQEFVARKHFGVEE